MPYFILIVISFFGFVWQSLETYHKSKFNSIDKFIFSFLLITFFTSILILIFNFK